MSSRCVEWYDLMDKISQYEKERRKYDNKLIREGLADLIEKLNRWADNILFDMLEYTDEYKGIE